jgi:hypothetical protein
MLPRHQLTRIRFQSLLSNGYRGQQNAANALIGIKFWPAREAARPPRIGRLSADSGSTAKLETL